MSGKDGVQNLDPVRLSTFKGEKSLTFKRKCFYTTTKQEVRSCWYYHGTLTKVSR